MSESKRMGLQFPVIWIDFSKSEEQTYECQEMPAECGLPKPLHAFKPTHTPLTHTED